MKALEILKSRGVSRLCHFTKLQSLTHILSSERGILASNSIRSDTKNVTDTERYDGELNYICCSVEYPNSWFLKKAIEKNQDQIFMDWVVLYIDLSVLAYKEAKFCPCNASRGYGKYIDNNMENIETIFKMQTSTFRYPRTPNMLACCPTDGQAEILIKDSIPRNYLFGIVVGNEEIAKSVYAILKIFEVEHINIYISPDVLMPNWNNMVREGYKPNEILYDVPEEV